MNSNQIKTFEVAGVAFAAVRQEFPRPHWLLRTTENNVLFGAGAGGISNISVPKMKASVEELLQLVSHGDVSDFRNRFGLPAQRAEATK